MMKKVGIIMGSDSDLPIVQKAVDMLKSLEIPYEVHIYSAHRTPMEAHDFATNARANGFVVWKSKVHDKRAYTEYLPRGRITRK